MRCADVSSSMPFTWPVQDRVVKFWTSAHNCRFAECIIAFNLEGEQIARL